VTGRDKKRDVKQLTAGKEGAKKKEQKNHSEVIRKAAGWNRKSSVKSHRCSGGGKLGRVRGNHHYGGSKGEG